MPAPGYKWNETPRLNRDIRERHKDRGSDDLWTELQATHDEVLGIAEGANISLGQAVVVNHYTDLRDIDGVDFVTSAAQSDLGRHRCGGAGFDNLFDNLAHPLWCT